jgi:hypoxanthine phosphoribosyltransferase
MTYEGKLKSLSWDEYFNKELKILGDKVEKYIKENNVKIDSVVPLLRGGNIPATYLAYRLKILKITPVQYKYFFEGDKAELRQIQKVNEELFDKDAKLVFLLVEGNHCFGTSASYAAKGLKEQFPNCEIIYAASDMDYNYQDVVKDAKVSFYGRLQNDCEECSKEVCEKNGLNFDFFEIFPWENVQEELDTLNMKQAKFIDIKDAKKKSKFLESFDLNDFNRKE